MSIAYCKDCMRYIEGITVPTNDGLELCPWCGEEIVELCEDIHELVGEYNAEPCN
jgi:predicted RNA-binding Zn-ribbon protein involved in translation (DUF1610 family)